jgi:hypothetical protein
MTSARFRTRVGGVEDGVCGGEDSAAIVDSPVQKVTISLKREFS